MLSFKRLTREMERAVNFFCENLPEFNPKDKTGGVLVYTDIDGHEFGRALIGRSIEEEICYATAKRKIQQLLDNPSHLSSYVSRDPKNGLWGGGIHIFRIGLFAFSGLPELADEACLLKALENCGLITDLQFIMEVLALSENRIYERLNI